MRSLSKSLFLLTLAITAGAVTACGRSNNDFSPGSGDTSSLRQKVVRVALAEWRYWGRQNGYPRFRRGHKESEPRYSARVRQMWWQGTGRRVTNVTGIGWSGAFISWVFRRAGAGRRFPYSGTHLTFIRQAIRNRKAGRDGAFLVGYRPREFTPRPGDLVCNARSSGVRFDDLPRRFSAHCDIVVTVTRWRVTVIGGNLSNSVSRRTLLADGRGRIAEKQPRRADPSVKSWFVVIRVDR